ncbi:MAG: hypothetical protein UR94_C0007G0010 [Parcubacteria group bacterium GW2011_GWA2_36_10]|nr:MAG: hypothetical protein UR94_C0007G0010 [Parcubacteria group bacterium GW2011_GWA2_36_10]
MFDDVKKGDIVPNQDFSLQPTTPSPAPAPMSAVDDMFGAVEKPSAISVAKLQVKPSPVNLPPMPTNPNIPNPILMEDEHSQGAIMKKVFVALSGLVLLALVVWGAYHFFVSKKQNPNTNNTQNQPVDNTNTNPDNVNNQPEVILDDDGDGLSNAEETGLGSDPKLADTDNDGLSDKDEVRIHRTTPTNPDTDNDGLYDKEELFTYQTNALDPDTDNDTYLDGVEVQNGYNPNGEGLLINK